jgi:hypothetical protein
LIWVRKGNGLTSSRSVRVSDIHEINHKTTSHNVPILFDSDVIPFNNNLLLFEILVAIATNHFHGHSKH